MIQAVVHLKAYMVLLVEKYNETSWVIFTFAGKNVNKYTYSDEFVFVFLFSLGHSTLTHTKGGERVDPRDWTQAWLLWKCENVKIVSFTLLETLRFKKAHHYISSNSFNLKSDVRFIDSFSLLKYFLEPATQRFTIF